MKVTQRWFEVESARCLSIGLTSWEENEQWKTEVYERCVTLGVVLRWHRPLVLLLHW